jgi:hypothetical protein
LAAAPVSPRIRKPATDLNFEEESEVIRFVDEQPVRGSRLSAAARSRSPKPRAQGSGVRLVSRDAIKAAPKDRPGNLTAAQRRTLKRSGRRQTLSRIIAAEAQEVNHPVSGLGTTAKAHAIPPHLQLRRRQGASLGCAATRRRQHPKEKEEGREESETGRGSPRGREGCVGTFKDAVRIGLPVPLQYGSAFVVRH